MNSAIVEEASKGPQWLPMKGYSCRCSCRTGAALKGRLVLNFSNFDSFCSVCEIQGAQGVLMILSLGSQVQYHNCQAIVLAYIDSQISVL